MTHDEVIALVQAHKEGKELQIRNDRSWEKVPGNATLNDILQWLTNDVILRIKHEPRYRAWTAEEVPDFFQGRDKRGLIFFYEKNKMWTDEFILNEFFKHCEYRTDLAKDEWHPCGVEVSNE